MTAPSIENITVYVRDRAVFIPMKQFNRFNGKVKLCRWFECQNPPKKPYREYCSDDCSNNFWKWYFSLFSWRQTCIAVWKREKGHCKFCKKDLRDKELAKRPGYTVNTMPADQLHKFEFDHIIPVAVAIDKLGYKYDIKFVREILYNVNNLRLLCYKCHKKVTRKFTQKWLRKKKDTTEEIAKQLDAYEAFRSPIFSADIQSTLLAYT